MSENKVLEETISSNPLEGAVRPVAPNSEDKEFYENDEECAGWVRHHLVDDKWFRCEVDNCSICLFDAILQEISEDIVGQTLTVIDTLNLSERQFKAVKDLIKNIVYGKNNRLELKVRRIIVNGIVPKEKA